MKYIIPAILLLPYSCKQKSETLASSKVNELRIHFTQKISDIDTTMRLDSFRLVRIDTLTMWHKYAEKMSGLLSEVEAIQAKTKSLLEDYKNNMQLVNLSRGLSSTLYSTYKQDADENKKDLDAYHEKVQKLLAQYDSLSDQQKLADSVKVVRYNTINFFQIRRKDLSVWRDTAYIILNADRNIVTREDFSKL